MILAKDIIGIDVSKHQGKIDWDKVKQSGKAGFVFLKAGEGTTYRDPFFKENYEAVQRLGIPYGVYWFCNAFSEEKAESEANACVEYMKQFKKPELGIFYDIEADEGVKNSSEMLLKIAKIFCDKMKANGYFTGVYASESLFNAKMNQPYFSTIEKWIAKWGNNKPRVNGDTCVWQFTSDGSCDGISGRVDTNLLLKNIEYSAPAPVNKPSTPQNIKPTPEREAFKAGDTVYISKGAKYYNGASVPSWVINQNWIVKSCNGDRVVIDKNQSGTNSINSPISAKYLQLVQKNTPNKRPLAFTVGDRYYLKPNAKQYGTNKGFASWVYKTKLYIRGINGDRVVVSTQKTGAVTGAVAAKDIDLSR